MKYLVVKLSAIGDCVCTLPAVHRLRQTDPKAHIAWLVEDRCAPLLVGHPEVDELIVARRSRLHSVGRQLKMLTTVHRQLRAKKFDVAIDFQGLIKSAWGPLLAGIPRRVGFADAREMSHISYTDKFAFAREAMHAVTRNLRLVHSALRCPGEAPPAARAEFIFPPSPAAREAVTRFLSQHGLADRRYAVLSIWAGRAANRWLPERFGELARTLVREMGLGVVLSGSAAQTSVATRVMDGSDANQVIDSCGVFDLPGLVELVRRAAVVVSADSAPMHIADAVGCPAVALVGATDPARTGPYLGDRARVIWDPPPCAPCYRKRCPNPPGTFMVCMKQIETAAVESAVRELLDRAPAKLPAQLQPLGQ